MTTGELLKQKLKLNNFKNVKICRVIGLQSTYIIYFDSVHPKYPITTNRVDRLPKALSVYRNNLDMEDDLSTGPIIDIERYNGNDRGVTFLLLDLGSDFLLDDRMREFNIVKYSEIQKQILKEYTIRDLYQNARDKHTVKFWNLRKNKGRTGSKLVKAEFIEYEDGEISIGLEYNSVPTEDNRVMVVNNTGGESTANKYIVEIELTRFEEIASIDEWVDADFKTRQFYMNEFLKIADCLIWSNSPAWLYQGAYEDASDLGYSIYDFGSTGIPGQEGRWADIKNPPSGSYPSYVLTKHVLEVLSILPNNVPQIISKLNKSVGV